MFTTLCETFIFYNMLYIELTDLCGNKGVGKKKRLRRGDKNTQKNCTKKGLNDPVNHDSLVSHLEPDILDCKVKWVLGSVTMDKASGSDGIPVELFQILKDDAVKVLHSICQQIWKTQQWPQDWKRSFKSQRKAMPKNVQTTVLLSSFCMLAS